MSSVPQTLTNAQFELWFQEEMPRLYRYLCYQTRDRGVVEEITSRTCEKALSKVHLYDPARGDLRVWMFGIARNELRAYYRSLKQQPDLVPIDQLQEFTFQISSPEQEFQRKETFIQLFHVLGEFPERDRAIIGLRFGAELSLRQIASIMGLSENHVSVLLHRSIDKLKTRMKEPTHEIN